MKSFLVSPRGARLTRSLVRVLPYAYCVWIGYNIPSMMERFHSTASEMPVIEQLYR